MARSEVSGATRARKEEAAYILLFALVVASRLASAVHHVEDTDSLRFALSVEDFDVAELRPHFPGYPVFVALAKALTSLLGSYSLAFSLIGAAAVSGIIFYLHRLLRVGPVEPLGALIAALVFFNPLIWLLSNRYMPDLLGAACALAALYHLLEGKRGAGFFLAGLLAGIRLSYLPLLFPPLLLALRAGAARRVALGVLGVLVWLVPLVLDTGWSELIRAAGQQTEGHFAEFGGTIHTEPRLGERALGLVEALLAHGLGAYWPLRHGVTLFTTAGLAAALVAGIRPLRSTFSGRVLWLLVASWATYLAWIFFYQNVIYKSRHVLPLLPLLLLIAALGAHALLRKGYLYRALVGVLLAAYATVTLVLVQQHRRPTAIAQVAEHLRGREDLHVVSIPLVNFYLSSLGVEAQFTAVQEGAPPARPPRGGHVVAVGVELAGSAPTAVRSFYHNPYVNRMWPEVAVREYGRAGE